MFPFIVFIPRISLNVMTLNVESTKVYTQQGVPISVTGIAQVTVEEANLHPLIILTFIFSVSLCNNKLFYICKHI